MTSAPDPQTQGHSAEQQGPHRQMTRFESCPTGALCGPQKVTDMLSTHFLLPKRETWNIYFVGLCAHVYACVKAKGQLILRFSVTISPTCLFEKGSFIGLESPDLPSVADQSPEVPAVFASPTQ